MKKRLLWASALSLSILACACADDATETSDEGSCDFKPGSCECTADNTIACAGIIGILNATYTCKNNTCQYQDCVDGYTREGNQCVPTKNNTDTTCQNDEDCHVENAIYACTEGKCNFTCNNGYTPKNNACVKGQNPSGEVTFELISEPTMQLAQEKSKGEINVNYKGLNGPQNGFKITVASSNPTCVSPDGGEIIRTDETGNATASIIAMDMNCTASITLTAGDKELNVLVEVGEAPNYTVNFAFNYLDAYEDTIGSRIKDVTQLNFAISKSLTCPSSDVFEQGTAFTNVKESFPTPSSKFTSDSSNPIYTEKNVEFEKADGDQLIIAAAFAGEDVIAYGCSEVFNKSKAGQTIKIDVAQIPFRFDTEYEIISNFDLTSGFPNKYSKIENLPEVEAMGAGDWIQFFVDLFKDPVQTLVYFIWQNSINRLNDIPDMPDWISKYILGTGIKDIAIPVLSDFLKGLLDNYKWYTVLTSIAPDISDLVTNMQFSGKFEVDPENIVGRKVSNVKTNYLQLEYQWSLLDSKTNQLSKCFDTYGKSTNANGKPTCRRRMMLDKLGTDTSKTMSGTWNGIMTKSPNATADALLSINNHSLTFKWASILYAAVFGTILPEALDYSSDPTLNKGQYIKAFLSKVLFETVVNYYETKCQNKSKCDGSNAQTDDDTKKYAQLKISNDGTNACQRCLEAILNLIWKGASDVGLGAAGINVAANFACGDNGLGRLEDAVTTSLNQFNATTENALMISSDKCSLFADDEQDPNVISKIGKPDEGAYTANDILTKGSTTSRCSWDVNTAIGGGYAIKGFFHGEKLK